LSPGLINKHVIAGPLFSVSNKRFKQLNLIQRFLLPFRGFYFYLNNNAVPQNGDELQIEMLMSG
jgi:hypothetical protein